MSTDNVVRCVGEGFFLSGNGGVVLIATAIILQPLNNNIAI